MKLIELSIFFSILWDPKTGYIKNGHSNWLFNLSKPILTSFEF